MIWLDCLPAFKAGDLPTLSACCIAATFCFTEVENNQARLASSKHARLGSIVNQFRKLRFPLMISTTLKELVKHFLIIWNLTQFHKQTQFFLDWLNMILKVYLKRFFFFLISFENQKWLLKVTKDFKILNIKLIYIVSLFLKNKLY